MRGSEYNGSRCNASTVRGSYNTFDCWSRGLRSVVRGRISLSINSGQRISPAQSIFDDLGSAQSPASPQVGGAAAGLSAVFHMPARETRHVRNTVERRQRVYNTSSRCLHHTSASRCLDNPLAQRRSTLITLHNGSKPTPTPASI